MFEDADAIEAGSEAEAPPKPNGKGGKVRLLRLDDLDGRTRAASAARQTFADIIMDMGGADHVSAGQRALAEQASILTAMAMDQGTRYLKGEPVDPVEYATICNAQHRVLKTLGLERRRHDAPRAFRDTFTPGRAA